MGSSIKDVQRRPHRRGRAVVKWTNVDMGGIYATVDVQKNIPTFVTIYSCSTLSFQFRRMFCVVKCNMPTLKFVLLGYLLLLY